MSRKFALIFLGPVISLFLAPQVGSAKPLVVSPSSLSFAIPPGGVDTYYLEVLNLDNFSISVKSNFDSGWMFLFSSEPKLEEEIKTEDKRPYIAWIEVEYKDSYLKIRAFCFNNTSEDEVLRYKLEATKSGKSGRAHTRQSGSVHIPSQEKKSLSQLTLRVSPKDHYQITLKVYKDGKLIAENSVFYPPIRSL